MLIICPHCGFSKDVGEISIPVTGVTATCRNCQQQFQLRPEGAPPDEKFLNSCPSCGSAGPYNSDTDICSGCGLVFAKYLARLSKLNENDPAQDVPFATTEEIPLSRRILSDKRFWIVLIALLAAACIRFGHDWKLDNRYVLQPGCWQGEMTFRGKQHPFLLAIQTTDNGKLEGYMDWTETSPRYRLAIRGTHQGNHLLFEDYKFIEGSGQYGLHDNQDVYIVENELDGTAKNGKATMHAVKVAIAPDPNVEPGRR